jgi:DNA-binding transcriptional regulator YiaG
MQLMAKPRKSPWTAKKIRDLRKRLKLTQAAAAAKVGVTRRQWAAWEADESQPSGPSAILLTLLHNGKI